MPRSFALLALPLCFAAACSLVPDDGETRKPSPKGPQFDADAYALNAKEYMNGGQFGRAKVQWETFLETRPGDWMGRLGLSYADLFLAEEAVVERGDLKTGRALAESAKRRFEELRTGPIEDDAQAETATPMWKAALGSAMTERYLGFMDQIEARRAAEASLAGGADAAAKRAASEASSKSRDGHYAAAIAIFEILAAMKNASPEAVRQAGQLYLATHQDDKAEKCLQIYLDFAKATRKTLATEKEKTKEDFQADRAAVVATIYDQKLAGNAAKQVQVLDDLGGIAFARGDYRGSRRRLEEAVALDPTRRDLWFKLAQSEGELQMYETAITRLDEFLKLSLRKGAEFDEPIDRAMKLKKEYERKIAQGVKR